MTTVLKWLRWAAAAATVIALALLAWQCIDIYLDGNAPDNLDENGVHLTSVYSREIVAGRLRMLSLPLTICLAVLVVSGVMHLICADGKPQRTALTPENRLRLMKKRVEVLTAGALHEEKFRRNTWIATAAILAVYTVLSLAYLLNGDNFSSWELEGVISNMLLHVTPWVVLGLTAVGAAYRVCDASMLRECELLKGQPAAAAKPVRESTFPMEVLRINLYALAVVFIVLGVMNGGLYDVLVKAINICTECIGLG